MGCNLKPFAAIQRVRPPPGRGAARQPEASLAWETATSLVKRRQRMLKPCVSLEIMYPLQAAGEPLVLAAGRFAVNEQPEPILAAEFAGVGSVLQLDKGIGHGGEAERPQALDRGMDQHRISSGQW